MPPVGPIVADSKRWKSSPHFTPVKFAANMAAMLLFGLVVAFFCRRIALSAELPQDHAATPA